MLGDGSITTGKPMSGKPRQRFKYKQSNIHTIYFKYVLNVFSNHVRCVMFNNLNGKNIKDEDLFKHTFHFDVSDQMRTYWYPNKYVDFEY